MYDKFVYVSLLGWKGILYKKNVIYFFIYLERGKIFYEKEGNITEMIDYLLKGYSNFMKIVL